MFISESTVKTHLNTIFQILQVSNRVSCLQRARELGRNAAVRQRGKTIKP
ncbi:MAG: hypothetical protein JKX83_00530 [Pseudomonadales bacterium]|nr:hypothetical protein [Pseudomonadales bacterium]